LIQTLFEIARAAGVEQIVGEYIPTEKNRMVERFFDQFGFSHAPQQDEKPGTRHYQSSVRDFKFEPTYILLVDSPVHHPEASRPTQAA